MVFSSTVFLFAFLPVVAIIYFACPRKCRNAVLFVASLLFYGWGEPKYIVIMVASIVFNYSCGLMIGNNKDAGQNQKAKTWMIISVVGSLSVLAFFKYTDFALESFGKLLGMQPKLLKLALPIGISFYTFQIMSYTIDVYRGVVKAQKSLLKVGTYVALFPQLIAGPIVQYKTVEKELEERKETLFDASRGMQRFIIGLGKKVLIANQMGAIWEEISAMQSPSVVTAWIGALAFTFQIYFDFSGYSDMAIGLGHVFGFQFLENFNYPYVSKSITEFWRRWHISLSSWFREYVYIPLGGNRKGKGRQILNLLVVWFLTGLWHGASWNFVLWGLYYAALLILEKNVLSKFLTKLPKGIQWLYTFFFVNIGWVIFANTEFASLGSYFTHLFSGAFFDSGTAYLISSNAVMILIAAVASSEIPKNLFIKLEKKVPPKTVIAMRTIGTLLILVVSIAFLVGDSYNPFLYFRF